MPAFAHSRSTLPHSRVARATMALTCSKLETSAPSAIATPPDLRISSTTFSAGVTAGAVAGATEIVDDDLRAAAGQPQRMRASKTIARAGNDSDASVKPDCHDCSSQPLSKIDQADPVGHKRGFFLAIDFNAHIGARFQLFGFSQLRCRP